MYDLIIIGAGPAGATLARLLGGRRKILLADARQLGASGPLDGNKCEGQSCIEKCCGGLLAPDAKKWLAKQDISLPAAVLDHVQPTALRSLDLSRSLERIYPTTYINLNRLAFEQWLVSLLPRDVDTLYGHRCIGIKNDEGSYVLTFKGPGGEIVSHHARQLAGADGADSKVRRFLSREAPFSSRYIAVQDVFYAQAEDNLGNPDLMSEYVAFFHPALSDFYGWIIPKQDRILLGLAMPPGSRKDGSISRRMQELKKMLAQVGYDFKGQYEREGCSLLRPKVTEVFHGSPGAFLIGEAAGWISPSSAEGYSYAFATASALARAILEKDTPDAVLRAYKFFTLPLMGNIVYKQIKSMIMFTPLVRQMIMYSGVLAKV